MKLGFQLLMLLLAPSLAAWLLGPLVPHVSGAMHEFSTWLRERRLGKPA